jgi:hypothetical protein
MPDLDLVIHAEQGMRVFGKGDPVALWRVDKAATNAGVCC